MGKFLASQLSIPTCGAVLYLLARWPRALPAGQAGPANAAGFADAPNPLWLDAGGGRRSQRPPSPIQRGALAAGRLTVTGQV